MRKETIEIHDFTIWLVIDQIRYYTKNKKLLESNNEFLCYFKFTEPNTFNYGELFRGKDRKPIVFESPEAAIHYANMELKEKLI